MLVELGKNKIYTLTVDDVKFCVSEALEMAKNVKSLLPEGSELILLPKGMELSIQDIDHLIEKLQQIKERVSK